VNLGKSFTTWGNSKEADFPKFNVEIIWYQLNARYWLTSKGHTARGWPWKLTDEQGNEQGNPQSQPGSPNLREMTDNFFGSEDEMDEDEILDMYAKHPLFKSPSPNPS